MTIEEMTSEFASASGKYLITDLVLSLNEMLSKDRSFATAAAADAVLAFEALVKAHTNGSTEHVEVACQLFSAALFNSSTNIAVDITYTEE